MSAVWKTFCVHMDVRDHYIVEVKARSAAEACRKGETLYQRFGEQAFIFDISEGGTENWEAEEIGA